MSMKRSFAVACVSLCSCLLVGGCYVPLHQSYDPEQLQAKDNWWLCHAFHETGHPDLAGEIVRRGLVRPESIGHLAIGMNRWGVLCAEGRPYDINRTVSVHGITEQWVYRYSMHGPWWYVYFDNGVLTAWQR
jgi:hypothetical protein